MEKEQKDKLYKGFNLTSVCRADLTSKGIVTEEEALEITDEQMRAIASKMADAYLDFGYWENLSIIADHILSNN